MKRGPDLDIEALFTDLGNDPLRVDTTGENGADEDIERDLDPSDQAYDDDDYDDDDHSYDDQVSHDDQYSER